jgi:dTDP-L-rhamnose 4-epimerase
MSFPETAVVTGGAGLIGSHIVDELLQKGYHVKVIDNLHPQTHKHGKPNWIPKEVEFFHEDIRNLDALKTVVKDARFIFHQAAFGGFTSESSEYFDVNVTGTARIFEAIELTKSKPESVIVASSQAIFGELDHLNTETGQVIHPEMRKLSSLKNQIWEHVDEKGIPLIPLPAREDMKMRGITPYALSKIGQEYCALGAGRRLGISTACIRYGVTFGPRQSITNPYTGVISIFANRLKNNLSPIVYEDGEQVRDFVFVKDQAKLNIALAESGNHMNLAINSGTGVKTKIKDLAYQLHHMIGGPAPLLSGQYRPGDARHFFHSTELINSMGFINSTNLNAGIQEFLNWFETQPVEGDSFEESQSILAAKGVLRKIGE